MKYICLKIPQSTGRAILEGPGSWIKNPGFNEIAANQMLKDKDKNGN